MSVKFGLSRGTEFLFSSIYQLSGNKASKNAFYSTVKGSPYSKNTDKIPIWPSPVVCLTYISHSANTPSMECSAGNLNTIDLAEYISSPALDL